MKKDISPIEYCVLMQPEHAKFFFFFYDPVDHFSQSILCILRYEILG